MSNADSEKFNEANPFNDDDFFFAVQKAMMKKNAEDTLKFVISRSTESDNDFIEEICQIIKEKCIECNIPTEGKNLNKMERCVKAFIYLVCNTNFKSQSLLEEDIVHGYFVDIQPAFSPYLFLEIIWKLNFEDILTESILYFPLDLNVEMLNILVRNIDLLEFNRELKLLTAIILNSYKKFIVMEKFGTQTADFEENIKCMTGIMQELIQKFFNERFLKLEKLSYMEKCKRHGVVLKKIIQIVKECLTCKITKDIKYSDKLYKLTFGHQDIKILDTKKLSTIFESIDHELINLLLKKVKLVDLNIYLNWTEFDDENNSSMSLQRAIGLDFYFLIEFMKSNDLSKDEYTELISCMELIASKPDPQNIMECKTINELCSGVLDDQKECLISLFHRYKEWDNEVTDLLNKKLSLITKVECFKLLNYLISELINLNNTQNSSFNLFLEYFGKAVALLDIKDFYDFCLSCILRIGLNENIKHNLFSSEDFLSFLIFNNFSFLGSKNLRIVLFYLCFNTKEILRMIIKLTIEHSNYPNKSINIKELKPLQPIFQIRIKHNHSILPLANKILQEICLENSLFNTKKFSNLLSYLKSIHGPLEIVNNILQPFLENKNNSFSLSKFILLEIDKSKNLCTYDSNNSQNLKSLIEAIALKVTEFRKDNVLKCEKEEIIDLTVKLIKYLIAKYQQINLDEKLEPNCDFVEPIDQPNVKCLFRDGIALLKQIFSSYCSKLQLKFVSEENTNFISVNNGKKVINQDDIMIHLFSKCTKLEYCNYSKDLLLYFGEIIKLDSKMIIADNLIRLTFEACLLFIEYPKSGPSDIVGYLIKCLTYFIKNYFFLKETNLEEVIDPEIISKKLMQHLKIISKSIQDTILVDSYNKLLDKVSANLNLTIDALNEFADECMQKTENLKSFNNIHSPQAIRLWLGHQFITGNIVNAVNEDEYKKIFLASFSN